MVTLEFGFEVHMQHMEKPESRRIAEKIISSYLGHDCQIACTLDTRKDHLVNLARKHGGQVISVEER